MFQLEGELTASPKDPSSVGQHLNVSQASPISDSGANLVTLASSGDGTRGRVAIAWLSGSAKQSRLIFSRLATSGTAVEATSRTEIPVSDVSSKPQLQYAPRGFASTEPAGGWYLLWAEQPLHGVARTRLARIRDADDSVLEVVTVTSGGRGFPLLFPAEDGSVVHGLVEAPTLEIPEVEVFSNWCQ
jgi:hypothetical protein